MILTAQAGQSMYDLCLQAYGNLDYLVKLCIDNNIDDVNYSPPAGTQLTYDVLLVVNQAIAGLVPASAPLSVPTI